MSQLFHLWYAHPLPFDADSAHEHWRLTRTRDHHEPRLERCVKRLEEALWEHDPDMLWTERPEAEPPCSTLTLAPTTDALPLVADALFAAARAEGLCVINPFDGSVSLPDGRLLTPMSLVLADVPPEPPATPAANTAEAEALQGDAPLAGYLLRHWSPMLRAAGFRARPRPTTAHPWFQFEGKVLRVRILCSVVRSTLRVTVLVSPGGSTSLPVFQTEFGCGELTVDLVALARRSGLRTVPDTEQIGARPAYTTHVGQAGGPAQLAARWSDLFGELLRWLRPLDDIQALAIAVEDRTSPFQATVDHPVDGFMAHGDEIKDLIPVMARRPGSVLRMYRRVALLESHQLSRHQRLRSVLPAFGVPLGGVPGGVRHLIVWRGDPACSDPLAELERLQSASGGKPPVELQHFLDKALSLFPVGPASDHRPWSVPPEAVATRTWLSLAFACDDAGNVPGAGPLRGDALLRLQRETCDLGLTLYSPEDQCVWTPDDRLHCPPGRVNVGLPEAAPLVPGQPLSRLQEVVEAATALAPQLQARGFQLLRGRAYFVRPHLLGIWRASFADIGHSGMTFTFTPYCVPSVGEPQRSFQVEPAIERMCHIRGLPMPELPRPLQASSTSPERFKNALNRLSTLLDMGALDLVDHLQDPVRCAQWVASTDR